MSGPHPFTYDVDPARLAAGRWSHEHNRTLGQGDIDAAYSADRIGLGKPMRKPFPFRGSLWVCVGLQGHPVPTARAYRLLDPEAFDGVPTTYAEKTRDAEAARNDANGFCHGMTVTHGGRSYVLSGPPARFVARNEDQLDLFGGA